MAKNKKNQAAAIRFGPALKALFVCLLIAGSAVGYVWQKSQVYQLSKLIKQAESRLNQRRHERRPKLFNFYCGADRADRAAIGRKAF